MINDINNVSNLLTLDNLVENVTSATIEKVQLPVIVINF